MTAIRKLGVTLALATAALGAQATPLTDISPTGFNVTNVGASTVGGIVVELVGLNGVRVVSQLAASSLLNGQPAVTPVNIGTQGGFGNAVTGALGGGLASASFRFSLFDGDSAAGNFDYNQNTLLVNGVSIGNWSAVATQNTDGLGNAGGAGFSNGFRNNLLDTGWFSTGGAQLASLFAAIDAANAITFQLLDVDAGDNFFDFTQGIDIDLINVGSGPIVTNPGKVPVPGVLALAGLGLLGLGLSRRRA